MLKRITTAPLDVSAASIRLLAERGQRPRLAMRGTSMHPTLREPMVLELGPPAGASIGDVVVFQDERLTAHRVIALESAAVRTAGDATPGVIEVVPNHRLIGKVASVWSHHGADARRIDGSPVFRAARAFAALHPARVVAARAPSMVRAVFGERTRPFGALLQAIAAIEGGDVEKLREALAAAPAWQFVPAARRHRCASLLADAMRADKLEEACFRDSSEGLLRTRYAAAMHVDAYMRQVHTLVRALNAAGVPFVLLKGAARMYADPQAERNMPTDIDVLVAATNADRAAAALCEAGYRVGGSKKMRATYRAHHHLPPLVPADLAGAPIELHVALAPPGRFTTPLDAASLMRYVRAIDGPAGRAGVLDDEGSALHLLIHALGVAPLRDIVLAARLLRRLPSEARGRLRRIVAEERRETVRLRANLALAERLAGIGAAPEPRVGRYLRWVLQREDLPRALRDRAAFVEALLAGVPSSPFKGNGLMDVQPLPLRARRVAGEIAGMIGIGAYALVRRAVGHDAHRPELLDHSLDVALDGRGRIANAEGIAEGGGDLDQGSRTVA